MHSSSHFLPLLPSHRRFFATCSFYDSLLHLSPTMIFVPPSLPLSLLPYNTSRHGQSVLVFFQTVISSTMLTMKLSKPKQTDLYKIIFETIQWNENAFNNRLFPYCLLQFPHSLLSSISYGMNSDIVTYWRQFVYEYLAVIVFVIYHVRI